MANVTTQKHNPSKHRQNQMTLKLDPDLCFSEQGGDTYTFVLWWWKAGYIPSFHSTSF